MFGANLPVVSLKTPIDTQAVFPAFLFQRVNVSVSYQSISAIVEAGAVAPLLTVLIAASALLISVRAAGALWLSMM